MATKHRGFDHAGSSDEAGTSDEEQAETSASSQSSDTTSETLVVLRRVLMGESTPPPPSPSSPVTDKKRQIPVPRFVIPKEVQLQTRDSITRRMSHSAPERSNNSSSTPIAPARANGLLDRLMLQVQQSKQAGRRCAKCNMQGTMVPWLVPNTLQCLAPSMSSDLGGSTVVCGYTVHTTYSPQMCQTAKCQGGMMQVEQHFRDVGYACRACRHFETIAQLDERLRRQRVAADESHRKTLLAETLRRARLQRKAEKGKKKKQAESIV